MLIAWFPGDNVVMVERLVLHIQGRKLGMRSGVTSLGGWCARMEERESEEESLLYLLPRLPRCHFAKLTRSSFSTVPKVLL